MTHSGGPESPDRVISGPLQAREDSVMQVLAPTRAKAGRPTRLGIISAIAIGGALVAASAVLLYLVFGRDLMSQFMPKGRLSTYELIVGALAWTFALTAPAGFGLIGVARLATGYERWRARQPRITPAVRLRRAIGDDHVVATQVRLPSGNRTVSELIIGPFGAAVIAELPPAGAVMSRGIRTWEVRVGNGYIRTIDNPLQRAAHDADLVRQWLAPEEGDYVLKVYAAVVGNDQKVERTATCAFIAPNQIAEWLGSLPPQRSLDKDRLDRIVQEVRAAL
jgi:hypothetical protein